MSDLRTRLTRQLEPILASADPRPQISAYHDMPYALFRYDPEDELELRKELSLLAIRLEQTGKRVTRISLAECLQEAMASVQPLEDWFEAERRQGTETVVETIHAVLAEHASLDDLVAARMPSDPKGRVVVPTVLCYPGTLDGAAGLRFMGVLDAEHNYRPRIF